MATVIATRVLPKGFATQAGPAKPPVVGQQNEGMDAWTVKRYDTSKLKIILLAVYCRTGNKTLCKIHFFLIERSFSVVNRSSLVLWKILSDQLMNWFQRATVSKGEHFEPCCNSDSTKIYSCLAAGFTSSSRFLGIGSAGDLMFHAMITAFSANAFLISLFPVLLFYFPNSISFAISAWLKSPGILRAKIFGQQTGNMLGISWGEPLGTPAEQLAGR